MEKQLYSSLPVSDVPIQPVNVSVEQVQVVGETHFANERVEEDPWAGARSMLKWRKITSFFLWIVSLACFIVFLNVGWLVLIYTSWISVGVGCILNVCWAAQHWHGDRVRVQSRTFFMVMAFFNWFPIYVLYLFLDTFSIAARHGNWD
jgi:hypothetical protein